MSGSLYSMLYCARPHSIGSIRPWMMSHPFPFFNALQKKAPIHFLKSQHTWIVSSYEYCEEVLQRIDDFNTRVLLPSLGECLVTQQSEQHKSHRQWMNGFFSELHKDQRDGFAKELAEQIIAQVKPGVAYRLKTDITQKFTDTLSIKVLGIYEDKMDDLYGILGAMKGSERKEITEEQVERYLNQFTSMAKPGGLLHSIISDDSIRPVVRLNDTYLMIDAGFLTIRQSLANLTSALSKDRAMQEYLYSSSCDYRYFINESFRLYSPFFCTLRDTNTKTTLGNQVIAEGDRLAICVMSANRDERLFNDPHTFHPERKNAQKHLAYGDGVHRCIGQHISNAFMADFFEVLKTKQLKPVVHNYRKGFQADPNNLMICGVGDVPVCFTSC